jgi:N-acetylglucosaminyl-diphospho-decaprenol L-rhamnosyltransferase
LADAALIIGVALARSRVLLSGKQDYMPPFLLRDTIGHSVFLKGFKLRDVRNPALG